MAQRHELVRAHILISESNCRFRNFVGYIVEVRRSLEVQDKQRKISERFYGLYVRYRPDALLRTS